MNHMVLILTSVFLNCTAQLLMKRGMSSVGEISGGMQGLFAALPRMAASPALWISMVCYLLSMVLWLVVLSKVEVSYAYPFNSIGYAVSAVVGYYVFAESISPIRILGILIICLGVILISQS